MRTSFVHFLRRVLREDMHGQRARAGEVGVGGVVAVEGGQGGACGWGHRKAYLTG